MHPFWQSMKIRQEKINAEEDRIMKNNDERARHSSPPKNFGQIQDIKNSDFFKTTQQHLNNIRKREVIQQRLNTTVTKLDGNQLDNFIKQTKD